MFKRLITLMMVLAITTTSAFANTNSGIKAAFDELNYSLTVEWDQKDKAFYDKKMASFKTKLSESKLSNSEMIAFVKSEVKDAKIARDMETALNMIQLQKMSRSEAANYMTETMKKSYSVGASWNGDAVLYIGLGVLLVVVALAVVAGGSTGGNGGGAYCDDVLVCDTYCYNDYYWGYTCEEDCFYATECY